MEVFRLAGDRELLVVFEEKIDRRFQMGCDELLVIGCLK
jgi:hypothetical protein